MYSVLRVKIPRRVKTDEGEKENSILLYNSTHISIAAIIIISAVIFEKWPARRMAIMQIS